MFLFFLKKNGYRLLLLNLLIKSDNMEEFEVVYAEIIQAEDFFDAIDKVKTEGVEVLTVSKLPPEVEDV